MKALMRRSPRPYDMEVVEAPLPLLQGPDWVRIKVAYAGVCGGSDIKLMKAEAGDYVQVKAAGGIRSLDTLLAMREAGATRIGTSASVQIMEEASRRLKAGERW